MSSSDREKVKETASMNVAGRGNNRSKRPKAGVQGGLKAATNVGEH